MSKKRLALTIGLSTLLVLLFSGVGLSSPGETRASVSPDRGMVLFEAYCAGCHGMSGAGDGPMAAVLERDFGMRPTDLTSKEFHAERTETQISEAITGGGKAVHRTPFMPAWGETLTTRQIGDLVSFIGDLRQGAVTPRATLIGVGEQLELGRVLYSVHCLACHGTHGKGDGPFLEGLRTGDSGIQMTPPPDMSTTSFLANKTDNQLEGIIREGMPHSGYSAPESKWWQEHLKENEIRALIFYLRALPLGPDGGKERA